MRVHVKLAPKAASDRIQGIHPTAEGAVLKVAVTAAPEKGKANARLIRLLADAFDVAKSDVRILRGETERTKVLFVAGDPDVLIPRMTRAAGR